MSTITSLNILLSSDMSQLTRDMRATSAELRASKNLFAEMRTPTETYTASLSRLANLLKKGTIDQQTYARAVRALRASLPSVVQAERERAAVMARGAQVAAQSATAEQRYRSGIRELDILLKRGAISQQEYNQSVSRLRLMLPAVQQQIRRQTEALRLQEQAVQRGAAVTRQFATAQERAQMEIREMTDLLRRGVITLDTYNRAMIHARRGNLGFVGSLAMAGGSVGSLAMTARLASNPVTAAAMAIGGVTLAAGKFTAASIRTGAEFEHSMSRVKALSGSTAVEFAQLEQQAKDLGRTTVFTASQAAEAMQFFALAGFKVNDITQAMPATLSLAAAGQLEIAQAADIAAKIMAGMGIEANRLVGVADVLTMAMTTANTDMVQLGEAMKFAAPMARIAGKGLNETVAAIQLLSNAGMQGELGGTALANIILKLGDKTDESIAKFKELGVTTSDASGNIRPLADILDDLNRAMGDMGSEEKLAVLGTLFEARAARGFAALLEKGGDTLREFEERLDKSGGKADEVANVQLDNLTGEMVKFNSAVESIKIEFFQTFGDDLARIVSKATDAASGISEMMGALKDVDSFLGGPISKLGWFADALDAGQNGVSWLLRSWGSLTGDDVLVSTIDNMQAERDGTHNKPVADTKFGGQPSDGDAMAAIAAQNRTDLVNSMAEVEASLREEWMKLDMGAEAYERYKFTKEGATDADVSRIHVMQQAIAALKEEQEAVKQATRSQEELLEKLREEKELFNLTSRQRQIAKAEQQARDAGIDTEDFDEARRLDEELTNLEKSKKIMDDLKSGAEDIFKNTRTPLEEFIDGMGRLEAMRTAFPDLIDTDTFNRAEKELRDTFRKAVVGELNLETPAQKFEQRITALQTALRDGLIDEQTFDLAGGKALAELNKATATKGPERPAALERGTAAAFSASFGKMVNPQLELARQQLAEAKRQTRELARANTRQGEVVQLQIGP